MEGSGITTPWTSLDTLGSETFEAKQTGIRIVVILTCALSVLGSLMIVFSFAYFKQLRSKPREILLHISLMDLGVSLANLIGASVYFDRFYRMPDVKLSNASGILSAAESGDKFTAPPTIDGLCTAQAFFAGYFTLGSVLWTIFLSVYIYIFLFYHKTKPEVPKYSLYGSYLISYGMPLVILLWLLLTNRLGYAPYNSSGWCSLIVQDPSTGDVDIFAVVLGNDLWIYLAIFLIPVLYFASHLYIHKNLDPTQRKQCRSLVYKFLLIPVVFLVLRVWTCILIILYTYIGLSEKCVPKWVNNTLLYLSGIGDSGQGFANAVLFVLFSQKVRSRLWRLIFCQRQVIDIAPSETTPVKDTSSVKRWRADSSVNLSPDDFEDTSPFLYESLDNTSLLIEFDKSSRII